MITIAGFVECLDQYGRLHCTFPDKQDEKKDIQNTRLKLGSLCSKKAGASPVKGDLFICKPAKGKVPVMIGSAGEWITDINAFQGHMVTVECLPCDYNFNGVDGWYLRIFSIRTIC